MKKKEYKILPERTKKPVENRKKMIQAHKKLAHGRSKRNSQQVARDPEEWRIED